MPTRAEQARAELRRRGAQAELERRGQVSDVPTFPGGAGGQFGGRGVTGEWEPAPKPKAWGEVITHGYRRAGTMMVKQLAGLTKMAGEFIDPSEKATERAVFPALNRFEQRQAGKLKEWSNMMLGGVEKYYDENPQEAIQIAPNLGYLKTLNEYITKPKNLVQGLIESSPMMLEASLGAITGGAIVGIPAMAVPISGEVYADARKEKTEPLPAMAQAILTGTGEAIIEQWTFSRKLGLAKNFRKMVVGGLPKVLWEGTKAFFRGTAEEGTQEFNRNFWQWIFTDRSQAWMENVAESAAAGGPMEMVMAGGFSAAGATGTMVSDAQKRQRVEKIRAAVSESEELSGQHKAEVDKELDAVLKSVERGELEVVPEAKPAVEGEYTPESIAARKEWQEVQIRSGKTVDMAKAPPLVEAKPAVEYTQQQAESLSRQMPEGSAVIELNNDKFIIESMEDFTTHGEMLNKFNIDSGNIKSSGFIDDKGYTKTPRKVSLTPTSELMKPPTPEAKPAVERMKPWEMTKEEFEVSHIFRGISEATEDAPNRYWGTLDMARAYARSKGVKNPRIRIARISDIPSELLTREEGLGQISAQDELLRRGEIGGDLPIPVAYEIPTEGIADPHKYLVKSKTKPAVEPEAPITGEPITRAEKDALRDVGFSVSEILDMDPTDARAMMRDPVVKTLDTSEQKPIPVQERVKVIAPEIKDPGMVLKYLTSKRVLMQRIGADKFTGGLLAMKERADVLKGTLNKEVNKIIRVLRRRASFGDRIASKIMKRQTKPVHRMVDMLDTYERLPDEMAKNLTPEEIDGFNKLRDITEWLLERTNIARAETGRPLIGNIKAYLPHWYDAIATEVINGTYIHKSGYIGRLMKNVPKTIPNRTALHREITQKIQDYMEQDLGTLMHGLISYDIHDMLLANPLAAAWDELLQLRKDNKISDAAYNEVANYIKYDILQRQAPIDKAFNNAAVVKTPTELINKVLRPLNREISDPAKTYFGGFRKLMHAAFLPFRPRPATRNLGQRLLNLTFYRGRDLLRAQFGKQDVITHPETGEQVKILDYIREQDWYKLSKPEDVLNDRTLLARLTSAGMIGFKLAHVGNRYVSNVEVSALTAYYDWKYRFDESHDVDSKHYKHIVEESKKTGIPVEQLQTQQIDMMNDIRDGVQQTQWEYMSHNMPVIFRGQTARGLAAYQSWWMNYFMSHTAEGWHRLITGRTRIRGDSTGGRLLTPYARLRVVKGMGAVYGMGKIAKKTLGIVMLSALFMPDPLTGGSPLLQLAANMAKIFLGHKEEKKQAWKDIKRLAVHLLPFSNAVRDIAKLSNDWTLKDYVFYTENEEWRQIWIPVEPEKKKKKKTTEYGGSYI